MSVPASPRAANARSSWGWLAALDGWFELIVTVGDSGFAYVLLIEDADGTLPELLAMCRRYTGDGPCA